MRDIVEWLRRPTSLNCGVLHWKAADEIERLRAALESLTKDPPQSLVREPDADYEVIWKMRAIARAALERKPNA